MVMNVFLLGYLVALMPSVIALLPIAFPGELE